MDTMVRNIFKVGPQVSGASFIGRKDWVAQLSDDLFENRCSISLVGPTRIGKSSLVNAVLGQNADRENCLILRLCMGEYQTANAFWLALLDQLQEGAEDADIWNEKLEKYYAELKSISLQNEMWGTLLRSNMRKIFKQIHKAAYRVVLAIDEFDGIVTVFGENISEYQLLRSLFSEPATYNTNGVIISRRNLKSLEQRVSSLSTFHGVFDRKTLEGFSQADLSEYFRILAGYGITLTEDGRDRLLYYTGGNPYLCCIFAQRMVTAQMTQVDSAAILEIYRERKADILDYYEDLTSRLKADNQLAPLLYLSMGSMRPLVDMDDLETMQSSGVLRQDAQFGYYAYCPDFMQYLRTQPLDVPYWELLISAERALKSLLAKACPELNRVCCQDLQGAGSDWAKNSLSQHFPHVTFRWDDLEQTCASLSAHKDRPTVLDALDLADMIGVILGDWDKIFCHHFKGDSTWQGKLQLISKLHNPLASASGQYISKTDLASFSQYCQELLQLNF